MGEFASAMGEMLHCAGPVQLGMGRALNIGWQHTEGRTKSYNSGRHTFPGGASLIKDIHATLQKVSIHCHVSYGIQRRQHRVIPMLCMMPLSAHKETTHN